MLCPGPDPCSPLARAQVLHCRQLGINAIVVMEQYYEVGRWRWSAPRLQHPNCASCMAAAACVGHKVSGYESLPLQHHAPLSRPQHPPTQLDMLLEVSKKLDVRPAIGIRAKLTTQHKGHWGSTSGGWRRRSGGRGGPHATHVASTGLGRLVRLRRCCQPAGWPRAAGLSPAEHPRSAARRAICAPCCNAPTRGQGQVRAADARDRRGGVPPGGGRHAGLPAAAALPLGQPDHQHPGGQGGHAGIYLPVRRAGAGGLEGHGFRRVHQ